MERMEKRKLFMADLRKIMKQHQASLHCDNWDALDKITLWFGGPSDSTGRCWCVDVTAI